MTSDASALNTERNKDNVNHASIVECEVKDGKVIKLTVTPA